MGVLGSPRDGDESLDFEVFELPELDEVLLLLKLGNMLPCFLKKDDANFPVDVVLRMVDFRDPEGLDGVSKVRAFVFCSIRRFVSSSSPLLREDSRLEECGEEGPAECIPDIRSLYS